jgi:hypothetical protein
MDCEIPSFELNVLRWHKDRPRIDSDNFDRRDAQLWLAMTGFLGRNDDGEFSITTRGIRVLATCK